jgi:hypothetical protein
LAGIIQQSRANLSNVVLKLRGLGIDAELFPFIDMPDAKNILAAESELRAFGAVDKKGVITEIGLKMLDMPFFEPSIARMVVEAEKRDCLEVALVLATLSRESNIFLSPSHKEITIEQKRLIKERGYEFLKRGNESIVIYDGDIVPQSRVQEVMDSQKNEALMNLREKYLMAHNTFGNASDWERNLNVFAEAIDHSVFDAARNHTPHGRDAKRKLSQWCRDYFVNESALLHVATHVFDYASVLKVTIDRNTLGSILKQVDRDDMSKVILSGHPQSLLFSSSDGYGMPAYDFFREDTSEEINISPGSAAFRNSQELCIANRISEGKGTRGRREITRNYAEGVHPVSLESILEIAPHLIIKHSESLEYDESTGKVVLRYKVSPKKNTYKILGTEDIDATLEQTQTFFAEKLYRRGELFDFEFQDSNTQLVSELQENRRRFGDNVAVPDLKKWYAERVRLMGSPLTAEMIKQNADIFVMQKNYFLSEKQEQELGDLYPQTIDIFGFGTVPVHYAYSSYDPHHTAEVVFDTSHVTIENYWKEYKFLDQLADNKAMHIGRGDDIKVSVSVNLPEHISSVHTSSIEKIAGMVDAQLQGKSWEDFCDTQSEEVMGLVGTSEDLPRIASRSIAYYTDRRGAERFAFPAVDYRRNDDGKYVFVKMWVKSEEDVIMKQKAFQEWKTEYRKNQERYKEQQENMKGFIKKTQPFIEQMEGYSRHQLASDLNMDADDLYRIGRAFSQVDLILTNDAWVQSDLYSQSEYENLYRVFALASDRIDVWNEKQATLHERMSELNVKMRSIREKAKNCISRAYDYLEKYEYNGFFEWNDISALERMTERIENRLQGVDTSRLNDIEKDIDQYIADIDALASHLNVLFNSVSQRGSSLKDAFLKAGLGTQDNLGQESNGDFEEVSFDENTGKKKVEKKVVIQDKIDTNALSLSMIRKIESIGDLEERALTIMDIREGLQKELLYIESALASYEQSLSDLDDVSDQHKAMKKDLEKIERDLKSLTNRAADKQKGITLRGDRSRLKVKIDQWELRLKELRTIKNKGFEEGDRKELLRRQIDALQEMENELLA